METELLEDFAKWLTKDMWYYGELMGLWYQEKEEEFSRGKTFDDVMKEFKYKWLEKYEKENNCRTNL